MNTKLLNYVKSKFVKIAEDLVKNPQGLKFKLAKAKEKINKKSVIDSLGKYVDDLKTLMRLLSVWISRKYTDVETQTIVYTVLAVVYFVTPTDFVPDFVLGLGFVDDIAVISWVLEKIRDDVKKFKQWEKNKSGNKKDNIA
jgi:uncharacterized membrane protein YkvA (DUF1232 family)